MAQDIRTCSEIAKLAKLMCRNESKFKGLRSGGNCLREGWSQESLLPPIPYNYNLLRDHYIDVKYVVQTYFNAYLRGHDYVGGISNTSISAREELCRYLR